MKKKVLSILIAWIFILSGIGAVALSDYSSSNEKIITEKILCSQISIEKYDENYVYFCGANTPSYVMHPGKPLMPKIEKHIELPFESGKPATVTHTWSKENLFNIRAKAKDENGLETEWSTTEISVPKKYETSSNPVHLDVSIFGASLLTGIRQLGFAVHNTGGNPHDKTIEDIMVTFTVKSLDDENIDFSYSKEIDSMAYNEGNQFLTNAINGFGPVKLSLMASSSNAGEVSKTIKGYQIGSITLSQNFLLSELIQ